MQAGPTEHPETVATTGRGRGTTAAWVLLGVLLLASGALFVQHRDSVANSRRAAFDAETDEVVAGVERGLERYKGSHRRHRSGRR
ncbi:MAG: hypothetical protein M5U31_01580 [Acidimicrobiia bacterium]|nr:hypothetical protein [Acidimicrobiia bacterium]